MKVLSIFILLLTTCLVGALRFTVQGQQPFCLGFSVKGHYTLYYVSSGTEQHDVTCDLTFNSQKLLTKTSNDLEFSYNYTQEGRAQVCFLSTDGQARMVSFDFYNQNDPLVNIIEKRDIQYIEKVLKGVHRSLQAVSRNQQFHIERDESHKIALEDSESRIKWTGIVKIVFLLSSALIQLWIMKGFFKNNASNSYQPVEMT